MTAAVRKVWDPVRYDRRRLAAEVPDGRRRLAGVDEAGRGCLAGPLVAAAVVIDYGRIGPRRLDGITDSKLLTPNRREELFSRILALAERVSIAVVSAATIDERGLHKSNLAALATALEGLHLTYDLALVDGFDIGRPDLGATALVGGDGRSAAIGAASVVAKVTRDRLMRTLDASYPQYGFALHVGYATSQHREALRAHGPCAQHRRSFAGVGETQLALFAEEGAPTGG